MAFHWEAISTKLLAERCRMESKLISSYLKQLDGFGIIETIPTGNKNHLYRIAERFFNMWLIVTQGNPDQKRRAKYLTLFLESFYDEHELVELAKGHIEKLKAGEIGFDKAMVLSKGLVHSRFIGLEERDAIIILTNRLDSDGHQYELPDTAVKILLSVNQLIKNCHFEEALIRIEDLENEADGKKCYAKGYCYLKAGNQFRAEKYFLSALSKGEKYAAYQLGQLYMNQGKTTIAEEFYLKAVEQGVVEAMNNIGVFYHKQGNVELAESFYKRAIENGHQGSLRNISALYFETNQKPKESMNYLKKFFKANPLSETKGLKFIVEIWNGITEGLIDKIKLLIVEGKLNDFTRLFSNLLVLSQTHLVLSLFHDPELGKDLIAKYELLYYATLILAGETGDNLLLRIPPEVMPTVEQIVAEVREKQAFYAQPPGE